MTLTGVRPRTRWFGTLKFRLMVASMAVIAASVALATLAVLQRVQHRSEVAVMDLERENAERMATLLGQRMVGLQKMLRATAAELPVLARVHPDEAAAALVASPALAANFASLFIAATDGRVLAVLDDRGATHPELDIADRDYFRRTLADGLPIISSPMEGRRSHEPVIQMTMPVLGAGGRTVAVLGGTLRLGSRNLFDELTYAGSSGDGGVTTIVTDAAGTIISHPSRERVLRRIDTEPGVVDAVARWVAQGRPIEPLGFASHDGNRFVSMAGVLGADWMVFRVAPDAELLGGLAAARAEALRWAGAVALVGGLLLMAGLAWLLGPLSRLRQRVQALGGDGAWAAAPWPRADGEIGELSAALQHMLQERTQGDQARQTLLQQMQSVLAAAPVGIAITQERRFRLVGAEFCQLLGRSQAQLIGQPAHEIFAQPEDYAELGEAVAAAFDARQPYFGELRFRRRDGQVFWGKLQGRPVNGADALAGTIWLLEDVTELRATRERLSWSASHDALTRLLNRAAFEERLRRWLEGARAHTTAALLCIDLDRFKAINDHGGHAAGDLVLRDVAAVLQGHSRASDSVARLGGDEFALLLPNCTAAQALQLGERLRAAVAEVGIDGPLERLTVGASIGVVQLDAGVGANPADWLARADAACYAAKRGGRNAVHIAAEAPPPESQHTHGEPA